MSNRYTADFIKATDKLEELLAQREELETEIAKQKRKVAALHELAMPEEDATPITGLVDGLTDACRIVFRSFDRALYPAEVKDRVLQLGVAQQANLFASVYTVIRRLRDAGEIKEVFEPQAGGSAVAAYRWAGETISARLRRTLAEREAVREMAEAGSEIGNPPSLEFKKTRPQEGFSLAHTKPAKKK